MTRGIRRPAKVVALVLVALIGVLGAGVVISAIVSEPRRTTPDHVGVGNQHGQLVIFACVAGGIGEGSIARGDRSGGANAWSARLTSGPPRQTVPIARVAPGYVVDGAVIPTTAKSKFNLHGLTDSHGRPLLVTVLTFTPAKLRPGYVILANGKQRPARQWTISAGCAPPFASP